MAGCGVYPWVSHWWERHPGEEEIPSRWSGQFSVLHYLGRLMLARETILRWKARSPSRMDLQGALQCYFLPFQSMALGQHDLAELTWSRMDDLQEYQLRSQDGARSTSERFGKEGHWKVFFYNAWARSCQQSICKVPAIIILRRIYRIRPKRLNAAH